MASENYSIALLKDLITPYSAKYKDVSDETLRNIILQTNSGTKHDSSLIFRNELLSSGIDLDELLNEYFSVLAKAILDGKCEKDELAKQLINLPEGLLNRELNFQGDLKIALRRKERKELKEKLRAHDEAREEEELKIALRRVERKALKDMLGEREGTRERAYVASESHYVMPQAESTGKIKRLKLIRWAAILIVLLLPVGIVLFNQLGTSATVQTSQNKDPKDQVQDSDIDISSFLAFELPDPERIDMRKELIKEESLGYSQEEESIGIVIVSKVNQIEYLNQKLDEIEKERSKLQARLDNLNNGKTGNSGNGPIVRELNTKIAQLSAKMEECQVLLKEVEREGLSYSFARGELRIYSKLRIDKNTVSVYSLEVVENGLEKQFFVKIYGKYYRIKQNEEGPLKELKDPDLLSQLKNLI